MSQQNRKSLNQSREVIPNQHQQQHMNYIDDNINVQDYNNVNSRKSGLVSGNIMQTNTELHNGNSRTTN